MNKPSIGRIVHYRSKTGRYVMPAMIIATKETLWPEGVDRGDVPDITAEGNVHLLCYTTGEKIQYQEFDVSMAESPRTAEPGQWWWPERL
jgi:hypothetical protein